MLVYYISCFYQLPQINDSNTNEVWKMNWRPNENSNSIGNLALHLCGNVRQWILSGLGNQEDTRTRDQEFNQREAINRDVLIKDLNKLQEEVDQVLSQVVAKDLLHKRKVQIYQESGISILIHVIEHFSYHVGQISWITKMLLDESLAYYEGEDL